MSVSVIIPCKNEVGTVDNILRDLERQSVRPHEVIIVDSGSTDDLARHVISMKLSEHFRVVTARKTGVAEARNHGGNVSSGDILLFIDADARVPADFVSRFSTVRSKRSLEAGGFTQRMPSEKRGLQMGARAMNGYAKLMSKTPWPIAFSTIFSTRSVFDTIGGFDPELFIMEDYDYVYRAKKSGAKTAIIDVPFIASDRRYTGDDAGSITNGMYGELYRYTHGLRITKPIYDYKLGGKSKSNKG